MEKFIDPELLGQSIIVLDRFSIPIILSLISLVIALLVHRYWLRRHLSSITYRIGFFVLLGNLTQVIMFEISRQWPANIWHKVWALDGEFNIPSFFTAYLMISVGVIAIAISILATKILPQNRVFWLAIGFGFMWLSMDEALQLHEENSSLAHLTGQMGILLLLGTFAMIWIEQGPRRFFLAVMLLGFGISAYGGFYLDKRPWLCLPSTLPISPSCVRISPLEETMENIGLYVSLMGVLGYAANVIVVPAKRVLRLTLVLFLAYPIALHIGQFAKEGSVSSLYFLIHPHHDGTYQEWQKHAQPTKVDFVETTVGLYGYRLETHEIKAGSEFPLHLYFRSELSLNEQFGYSLQLMDQETRETVVSYDKWNDRNPEFWVAGAFHRQSKHFTIPGDAPRNRALWLTLSLWYQDDDGSYHDYAISASDRRLLSERQVILTEFVLPTEVDPSSGSSIATFDNGFELRQVELPAEAYAGEPINAIFTWFIVNDATEDWSQFLHFVHEESSTFWNHDQPPLGTRLPTRLWYAGLTDHETWQFTLPADLPLGRYQLYTGLYRLSDMTRMTGYDELGVPLPVGRLPLGYIQIVPIQEESDG